MKKSTPTWDETEEFEDIPSFDDTIEFTESEEPSREETSMSESAGRGAVQGATLGFADEIGAAALTPLEALRAKISSLIPDSPENVDAQLREQGFGGDIQEKDLIETYKELRDTTREANIQADEDNPWTYGIADVVGGVAPALVTGGGAAAAKVASTVGKQGIKEASKLGAKYGAASGLGYGESDLTEGDVSGAATDVALGTAIGGTAGAGLPLAAKALKGAASKTGETVRKGIEAILPEAEAIKAGYKYGKEGKKLTQEVVDADMKSLASSILDKIKTAKNELDLDGIKQQLDDLGIKVDTKESFETAIDDIQKIVNDDILDISNKDLLPKLQKLAGVDTEALKMANKAEKTAIKKALEAQSKQEQAVIKGEKKLADQAIKSGDDLETVSNVRKQMDDLDIPFDTPEGQIGGAKGKFKNVDGEEYVKTVTSDTTPYQPQISKTLGPDGRPIVQTKDLGSGKISAIVGDISNKVEKDLANMNVSEVESIRKQLNVLTKIAKTQGTEGDPVIQRAKQLAVQLRDLTDKAISEGGPAELATARKKMSDILSAEDLLGVSRTNAVEAGAKQNEKVRTLADKLGFIKGFKSRDEASEAVGKLGDDIFDSQTAERFDMFKELNAVMGRESSENISRAGLYKKAAGQLPNVFGRAVKSVSDNTGKVLSPLTKSKDIISKLSSEELSTFGSKLSASENKGLKNIGDRLLEASRLEGAAKQNLLWSLSQSPAMRELIKREAIGLEEDEQEIGNELFEESQPVQQETESVEPLEVNREPAGSDYFKAQTESVNLDVDQNMLNTIESVSRELGYDDMVLSSGRRDTAKTEEIMEQRKEAYGLNDFTPEEQVLIDKLLLRGDSPDNIEYANRADVNAVLQENFPDRAEELIEKFKQVRSNFGGYQSAHLQGKKVDIPYSYFVNKYGETEGKQRAKQMIEKLKEAGLGVIDEENTGLYGVIDVEASDEPQEETSSSVDLNAILNNYADQEIPQPEDSQDTPSEEQISDIESSIDLANKMQSSGDETPVDDLELLLEKINSLNIPEDIIDELEEDAMNMTGYRQGLALKEKLRRLIG